MKVGRNIEIEVKNNKAIITIDLTKEFGLSKSGKTTIIASSDGNQLIDTQSGAVLGLNIYKKS